MFLYHHFSSPLILLSHSTASLCTTLHHTCITISHHLVTSLSHVNILHLHSQSPVISHIVSLSHHYFASPHKLVTFKFNFTSPPYSLHCTLSSRSMRILHQVCRISILWHHVVTSSYCITHDTAILHHSHITTLHHPVLPSSVKILRT